MEHTEYRRIVSGADTAVLFIHGIAGTPRHFDPFLPLVPEGYSAVSLLLPGHGGTVRDFSRASMAGWETHVQRTVQELARALEAQAPDVMLVLGHPLDAGGAMRHSAASALRGVQPSGSQLA